jgi:peptidoglycan/LPS O-acetylase OafA/YrhL
MTLSVAIILYLVFCLLAGLCGSHRRMGFFGTFLLSLFLTPVLVLLLLILTGPSRAERDRSPQSN